MTIQYKSVLSNERFVRSVMAKANRAKNTRNVKEHDEQVAVIEWAQSHEAQIPQLQYLYAIPNGGKRHIATAIKLKREGVKSGVPDLCLPVPFGEFHSLYIEMKVPGNKPTDKQEKWHSDLRAFGHRVEVCYGADEAIETIKDYLRVPFDDELHERMNEGLD